MVPETHSAPTDLYDEFGGGTDNPNAEETFSPQSSRHSAVSSADQRFYYGSPLPRRRYGATSTGSADELEWKRLMFEWYGLTPCRGLAWFRWAKCPHRVGTGQCPRNYQGEGNPHGCASGQWQRDHGIGWPIWDHARAWRNAKGRVVITLEPYGNPFDVPEHFARLTSVLDPLGVKVAFEGRSPYGATYLLALYAPPETAPAQPN